MFWTEIGNIVKIERAGMDGSERRAVVNSSLGWPGGVAVDTISDRVYWTDERLRAIGSATLDGDDIRVSYLGRESAIVKLLSFENGHLCRFQMRSFKMVLHIKLTRNGATLTRKN